MKTIETRIAALEQSVRFYRTLFFSLVLISVVVFLSSYNRLFQVTDKIQTKSLEIVNDAGTVLVKIDKDIVTGNGEIITQNNKGYELVKLFTDDGGSGAINTFNNAGSVNFKVTSMTDGGGYLGLYNTNQDQIIGLGSTTNKSGYIKISNSDKNEIVWMGTNTSNDGYISSKNHSGYYTFDVSTIDSQLGGLLSVYNEYGNRRVYLTGGDKGGRVSVYNNNSTRVGYVGSEDNQDGYMATWNASGTRTGNVGY